jgi:RNA polymerase sigma-70 factor (ECF subfamily)
MASAGVGEGKLVAASEDARRRSVPVRGAVVAETGAAGDAAAADPDVALMLRLQNGDQAAFPELFTKFSPRVLQYARRVVGDDARAEEVTQDVFVQVFRFRHRYQPQSRFSTWLFTIATNLCLNELRRPERQLRVDLWAREGAEERALPDPRAETPEAGASTRELGRRLDAAVAQLPPKQRAALLLSRMDGLAYRDVGKALGCSEGAVKALLFRATQTLKRALREYLSGGSTMRGTRAERLMTAAVDGELTPRRRRAFDRHLDRCPTCRAELGATEKVLAAIAGLPLETGVPADLEARVVRRMRVATEDGRAVSWWPRLAVPTLAAAGAAVLALALGIGRDAAGPGPGSTRPRPAAEQIARTPVVRSAPTAPPPALAAAPDLFVDLPILRNLEKLSHFEAIATTVLDDDAVPSADEERSSG